MPKEFNMGLRMKHYPRMSRETREQILEIWKDNPEAEDRAVAEVMGVSRYAVENLRVSIGLKRRTGRKRGSFQVAQRAPEYHREHPGARASESVVAERERRLEAADRRTLSACLLGDPPPGYSAAAGKTGMT